MRQLPPPRPESMEDLLLRARQPQATAPWNDPLIRLGRFLSTLGRPAPRPALSLADALPYLFPKVRPIFTYQAHARHTGKTTAFRPLAGNFAVSLVVDLPNQDLDLGPEHLQAWGVDFDRLLQRARTNLLARGGEGRFLALRDGCYRSAWRDNLDGSRMLLPGMLQRLRLQGDPVVLLPNRDTLLVVGAEDPEGLTCAMTYARQHLDDTAWPGQAGAMRLRNYLWEPWDRPAAAQAPELQVPCWHPAAFSGRTDAAEAVG